MNELLKMLADKQFYKDVGGRLLDAANRGGVAGTLGAPVDIATMAMRPFGYNVEKPVMGSEWLGQKMQDAGMVSPERNAIAELLSSVVVPSGMAKAGAGMFNVEQNALRNLAAPATMNKEAGAIVWHGSPHKFDKFDSSKIGTGEGAQAYGHGLYLAENPKVAEEYAGKLSKKFVDIDGFNPSAQDQAILDRLSARANSVQYGGGQSAAWDDLQSILRYGNDVEKAAAKNIENNAGFLGGKLRTSDQGSLYKVDLPDEHIAKMLDWDRPLSGQAPEVQKALQTHGIGGSSAWDDITGFNLINQLGKRLDPSNTSVAASKALAAKGIPGIRYLDGGSRGAGAGSSNYVVFPGNENILQILERNGKAIP
jgi:hypothetical protein